HQGLACCTSPLHQRPMPRPHRFAAALTDKGKVRAAAKRHVTVYGYARVSTDGQSVDAQIRQLRAAGASKVFREVASGAKTDRPQLRRLLAALDAGDVVMTSVSSSCWPARWTRRPRRWPSCGPRRPGDASSTNCCSSTAGMATWTNS